VNTGKKAFVVLLLLLGAWSVNARAEALVFTAIPDQDESQLQIRFSKVATYLQQNLGVKVRYLPVKSYAAAITAFKNNQVQLAWFGGLSGVRARMRVQGSEAIAQGYEDQFFKTYFIANVEQTALSAPVADLSALKGFTFTFGSKGSTSGRLMPEFYLRKQYGVAPQEVFKRVGFSGDHSRTIALVQSGAFQVGAVNYKVWENAVQQGLVDEAMVKIIWETPTYSDYQWSIRGGTEQRFGTGFKQKVKTALLTMDDPELLRAFPRQSFVSATNADYEEIKQVAKSVGLID